MGKNRVYPYNSEYAGAQDDHYSGDGGFSQTAGGGERAVHERGDSVRERHDGETRRAGGNHSLFAGEQGEEGIPEEVQTHAQQ